MSADFRPRGRVRMTDGSIHGVATARKRHRCDGHLTDRADRHFMEPGERYVASALPPASSIGNTRWWHARFCADCAPVEYAEQVPR